MCFDVRCFCCQASTPTQYFWYRTTLMVSEDIDHPTQFNWKIGFALIIAWILVYMCMIKGIASSGKVMSAISMALANAEELNFLFKLKGKPFQNKR